MRAFVLAACLALPLAAQAEDGLTQAQQDAVDARIRAYLLENPEVIVEAIDILRAREAEAQTAADAELIAQNHDALFADAADPTFGAAGADVTMVEFGDYNCGYCKRAHAVVEGLLEEDSGLKLVFKHFPVLGEPSVLAARVAMAAQTLDDAKFRKLHDALLSHKGGLNEAVIMRLAGEAGFDRDALTQAMEDDEISQRIRENYELGRSLDISGTPAFVLGDEVLRGAAPAGEFQRRIKAVRDAQG